METPKHVSDELRKEVIEKFNLDPINNTWLIEVISFLYERNTKLEESLKDLLSWFNSQNNRIYNLEEWMKICQRMIFENYKQCIHSHESYKKTIDIKAWKLEEMINQIAKYIPIPDYTFEWLPRDNDLSIKWRNLDLTTLFDKWNKNEPNL